MSGISFKIQAPSRPSSTSAPSSRPSSAASRARPPHSSSTRNGDHDGLEDDSEDDEGAFGAAGRDRKRPRLEKGDEEVVEFGRNGATSKNPKAAPSGPLVIPALPNKDWRKAAGELRAGRNTGSRKKKEMYLPEASGGMRMAGAGEGSGNKGPAVEVVDKMNTEEIVGGLEQPVKREVAFDAHTAPEVDIVEEKLALPSRPPPAAETEEQRALRELLGEEAAKKMEPAELDAIVSAADSRGGPVTEEQAFKKDLDSRPDEATLDDYARVPVGQFGLAMLRGMGWQPGQAASRTGRGVVEAHVPSSRPALLGIGAKPMAEVMDDGAAKGKKGAAGGGGAGQTRRREDMKFVPLMKRERERIEGPCGGGEGSGSGRSTPITNGSTSSSRRSSRSPPPASSSSSRRDDRDRRRYDDDRDRGSSRRERDRDYDSPSSRRDRDRGSSRREYDDDRRASSRRDYDDDRDRDRRGGGSSSSRRDEDRDRRGGSSRYEDDRRDGERRRDDDRDRERGSSRRY